MKFPTFVAYFLRLVNQKEGEGHPHFAMRKINVLPIKSRASLWSASKLCVPLRMNIR